MPLTFCLVPFFLFADVICLRNGSGKKKKKKKSSPASLLFEPSMVTELTYLLTICLWPSAGEVCFDVFAARAG